MPPDVTQGKLYTIYIIFLQKMFNQRGTWVAQSIRHLTLNFGLGHDLRDVRLDPHTGLHTGCGLCLRFSLPLPLQPPSCSPIRALFLLKNTKKKERAAGTKQMLCGRPCGGGSPGGPVTWVPLGERRLLRKPVSETPSTFHTKQTRRVSPVKGHRE